MSSFLLKKKKLLVFLDDFGICSEYNFQSNKKTLKYFTDVHIFRNILQPYTQLCTQIKFYFKFIQNRKRVKIAGTPFKNSDKTTKYLLKFAFAIDEKTNRYSTMFSKTFIFCLPKKKTR